MNPQGKICGRRGCRRRHTSSGSYCRDCRAEYMRAYRAVHPMTDAQRAQAKVRAAKCRQRAKAKRAAVPMEREVPIPVEQEPRDMSMGERLLRLFARREL